MALGTREARVGRQAGFGPLASSSRRELVPDVEEEEDPPPSAPQLPDSGPRRGLTGSKTSGGCERPTHSPAVEAEDPQSQREVGLHGAGRRSLGADAGEVSAQVARPVPPLAASEAETGQPGPALARGRLPRCPGNGGRPQTGGPGNASGARPN